MTSVVDPEQQLVERILSFRHDPLGYSKFAYEWGETGLAGSTGPRPWQAGILDHIGAHLREPATRFTPCQIAVSSGHGIGKSALVSMLISWGLSTCKDTKIVVTANTGAQLATKTVPECAKWFRLAINHHWWEVNAQSIRVKGLHDDGDKTWRTDFHPWSDYNTEAFAGMHNQGRRIVLIFDEASAISDRIWEVAEGALTDSDTEIVWLAFGNPTQNTGRFRECFGRFAHRWKTFQIDSRTVEGTNKVQIQKWIDDYGEDSDFVRVRVRGEFPRAGSSQFIASDVVAECRKYRAEGYEQLPKCLSVDVARFGDDQTVVGVRQGRKFRILAKYRGLDTVQVAERVIQWMEREQPDGTIIDGIGVGAGVVDQITVRGFGGNLFEYNPSSAANDASTYANRRSEIWGLMRDWLNNGAEIPDDAELAEELTVPEYDFTNKSQTRLEPKDSIKARGYRSPDSADCLAMTFQLNLRPKLKDEVVEYSYNEGSQSLSWLR